MEDGYLEHRSLLRIGLSKQGKTWQGSEDCSPTFRRREGTQWQSRRRMQKWLHMRNEQRPVTLIFSYALIVYRLSRWHSGKESTCPCKRHKRRRFNPWVRKIPWRRKWQLTSVFLPGKFRGQRSLVSYSPWGCQRVGHDWANTRTHTHTHTHMHTDCIIN